MEFEYFQPGVRQFRRNSCTSECMASSHILLEWNVFQQESAFLSCTCSVKILSEYTDAPIGTDMMPFAGLDYEEMNAPMDVVMFNHYNVRRKSLDGWILV